MLARALIRYAVRAHVRPRNSWCAFLQRQLEGISGDFAALIWAAGCFWSLRVERLIVRAPPAMNSALFLAGLYVGVNTLFAHLGWYGFPRTPSDFVSEAQRGLIKVALFLGVVVVVGLASPGAPRRRIFAACTFPLLALFAMSATSVGMEFVRFIRLPGYPALEVVLQGLALGLLIAALLAVPAALLYRGSAVPVALLSVLPAIAKTDASPAHWGSVDHANLLVWRLGPFGCALAVVGLSTYVCNRLQRSSFEGERGERL